MTAPINLVLAAVECAYNDCDVGKTIDLNTELLNIDTTNCPLTVEVLATDCSSAHGMDLAIVSYAVVAGVLAFTIN
jgi:hypothetical protein